MLEEMMMKADGIILASPTYAMQVPALMKKFLDHFAFLFHRPRFFGKQALLVVTGRGGTKDVLKCLETSASAWGFHVVGKVATLNPDYFKPKYRDKQWEKG
jgi:multimeric flavodoxin WrbA